MRDWRAAVREHVDAFGLAPAASHDIVEELAQHLDDRYAELRRGGASETEAEHVLLDELADDESLAQLLQSRARRAAPAVLPPGQVTRQRWTGPLTQDVRYGLRALRGRPAFTIAAVLTLALGIGANTAIFSVLDAVILRPLPFPEPERLITYFGTAPEKGLPEVAMPEGLFVYHRENARTMESMSAFQRGGLNLADGDDTERIDAAYVSADFFHVLGVPPVLGRAFTRTEEAPDGGLVVILSDDLWRRRFGGDSSVIGRTIRLNGLANTIIGVAPRGFEYPGRSRAWVPLRLNRDRFNCWCNSTVARLRPGVAPDDARRELSRLTDDFGLKRRDVFPDAKPGGSRFVTLTLTARLTGDVRRPLLVLVAAVGLVLLIACANVANLLLARASQRSREMAVRCCLGASPRRIAAQLMTESLLLAVVGGSAGVVLATWAMRLVRSLPAGQVPRVEQVRLDPGVLLFTGGLALVTGILFGLAPALRAARVDVQRALKDGSRGTGSTSSRRVSDAFVVSQFALSLLLLTGAGLLLRSFQNLLRIDPGYRVENVLTARLAPQYQTYSSDTAVRQFHTRLMELVQALPGVTAAGITSRAPLSPGNPQDNIIAEGHEPRPGEPVLVANIRLVTPGYFAAIGTPIRRGRRFTDADGPASPRVAIVDETLVQRYWPNEDPIGKRIRHGDRASPWLTIVGVVPNVKHARLNEDASLQVYEPYAQQSIWGTTLVVRSTNRPEALLPAIRAAVKSVDAGVPLYEIGTLKEALSRSLGTFTLTNMLLLGFALLAMLLAAIGIYGVVSLNVTGRQREFGVRLALGASPAGVLGLVLRQGLSLAATGVIAGLGGALWLTPQLRELLVGVRPFDPATFVVAAAGLTAVAVVACFIPARRATRADPTDAMRSE